MISNISREFETNTVKENYLCEPVAKLVESLTLNDFKRQLMIVLDQQNKQIYPVFFLSPKKV